MVEKGYEVVYEWCKRDPKLIPEKIIKILKELEGEIRWNHPEMTAVEVRDTAIGRFFATKNKYKIEDEYDVEPLF